ncbi:MAG: hypothetical protein LBL66_07890 [Clostridiales bacterium]|jgi:uncharacterized protein YrrD|nr:hypothetical protein [Clostridiales bacterium]
MVKLSEFLGKPLISLYEGRLEGVVMGAAFEKPLKKAQWLLLLDERDEDCDKKTVALADVYALGENAVMIKSGNAVKDARAVGFEENNPLGHTVYTAGGKLLGAVEDVVLGPKYAVEALLYGGGIRIGMKELLTAGTDIMVAGDGDKPVKLAKPAAKAAPRPKPKDKTRTVQALETATEREGGTTERLTPEAKPANEKVEPTKKETAGELKESYIYEPAVGVAVPFKNPVAEKPQNPQRDMPKVKATAVTIGDAEQRNMPAATAAAVTISDIEPEPEIKPAPAGGAAEAPRQSAAVETEREPRENNGDKDTNKDTESRRNAENEPDGTGETEYVIVDTGKKIEVWPHETVHIPERIVADYGFLLGRHVTRGIVNSRNREIICAGQIVRPATVETASKFGRLVELTKYSE